MWPLHPLLCLAYASPPSVEPCSQPCMSGAGAREGDGALRTWFKGYGQVKR